MPLREYFINARDLKIEVNFMKIKGKNRNDWVCLRYRSSNFERTLWPEVCFFIKDNKWFLTNSLYNCQ
jgi:hypothetical protein